MSGVLGTAAVASRFPVPALWIGESMASTRSTGVRRVWGTNLNHCGNHLPRHAHSFIDMVSRDVVGHHPEERSERAGTAKSAGAETI